MNASRCTGAPHLGHGRPACPYTASDLLKYPDAPLTLT